MALLSLVLAGSAAVRAHAGVTTSRILILEFLPQGRGERVLVVDGATGRVLGAHATRVGALWTGDGAHILALSADRRLVLLDEDGRSARRLPIVSDGLAPFPDAASAPDGRRLVVARGNAVTVRALDGRVLRVLVRARPRAGEAFSNPTWSPDGRWVGFEDAIGYDVVPAAGGSPTVVFRVADDHDVPYVEWSRDSSAVLRSGGDQRVPSDPTLAMVDRRTRRMRVLPLPPGTVAGHAMWSPSGREIAFVSYTQAHPALAVDDVATGRIRRVATRRSPWGVSWSPDGRFLVAVTGLGSQIEVVPAVGGPARVLLSQSKPWIFSSAAWQPRR